MTALTPEIPVGQLVAERPHRARLFEQVGIDYCGGGRAPLARACAERRLDFEDVLCALAAGDLRDAEEDRFDAAGASMGAPAVHIMAVHHGSLCRGWPVCSTRSPGLTESGIPSCARPATSSPPSRRN